VCFKSYFCENIGAKQRFVAKVGKKLRRAC
jgi:hypothetical protein